ncbi:MAG TPA: cyclopropane fatty acyl phospholipid synthase [Gammaproteobacteria bacterium]|nr:cyclopropane fatty acyl phospholipid synthase [Gammaproteobacteria bacterium]
MTAGKATIEAMLLEAGVQLDGDRPFDLRVRDPRFFDAVLQRWSLGLGESWMAGWWDCERLDELICRLLRRDADAHPIGLWTQLRLGLAPLRTLLFNLQSRVRAFQVGERHYDLGNDLFEAMLDSRMIYSCAFWEHAADLEQAQRDKLAMICAKLELAPGEHLLDIGCGWGGLAAFAARHYGVRVTGVTVSREQQALAEQRCQGLPVTIRLCDYRDLDGCFDKIVSVGMFEHVGTRNYPVYFDTVRRLLKPEGLFLLHTIGTVATTARTDPFIDRYIFPNGKVPSVSEIGRASEGRFILEDWHNFGRDYDRTVMAWHQRFEAAWPRLAARYGERFRRMWSYYLLASAGFFRSRQGQLWQIVFSPRARQAMYRSRRPIGRVAVAAGIVPPLRAVSRAL